MSFPNIKWHLNSLIWDYTCSDTLCNSHVQQTSQEAGRSATQAERKKLAHYQRLSQTGYLVMPVATEPMGSWAPMALSFIKEIRKKIADQTGDKRSTSFLFQALGIANQRGNAASNTGTCPIHEKIG